FSMFSQPHFMSLLYETLIIFTSSQNSIFDVHITGLFLNFRSFLQKLNLFTLEKKEKSYGNFLGMKFTEITTASCIPLITLNKLCSSSMIEEPGTSKTTFFPTNIFFSLSKYPASSISLD